MGIIPRGFSGRSAAESVNLPPGKYVCGPTSLESVTELITAPGYDRDRIKTERFGATGAQNEPP